MSNHAFAWEDRYLLGHVQMDATHREFVECVDALLRVPDAELAVALAAFARHAESHFGEEDRWMAESDFPARGCHADEHAKVLESVLAVQAELAAGNVGLVRELAQALQDWFPAHADYMDSALAQWLVRRSHAGAPLVFRRQAMTVAAMP